MPGPLTRLLRQPLRAAAIVLLVTIAVAASGIQSAAAAALQATLDDEWRGTYDILVTPPDAMNPINGMLPPNTLASTGEGMTLDDLADVRAVGGVEIAAPIGEVLVPALRFAQARVAIPRGFVGASEQPQAYRVTATYSTNDGLGERLVETRTLKVVVDEAAATRPEPDISACMQGESSWQGRRGSYEADPVKYPALRLASCKHSVQGDGVTIISDGNQYSSTRDGWGPRDAALSVTLPSAPQTITRVTLIDPVAERALLGPKGAFLDPLAAVAPTVSTSLADMEAWATAARDAFGDRFLDQLARGTAATDASYSDGELDDLRRLFADNGDDWDEMMREGREDVRYAPIMVSEATVADLQLKIDVEAFGAAPAVTRADGSEPYALPDGLADGAAGTPVGSSVGDVSGLLNPFIAVAPALVWPGADLDAAAGVPDWDSLSIMATGSLRSPEYANDAGGIALNATGYRSPIHENAMPIEAFRLKDDPSDLGVEAAYAGVIPDGTGSTAIVATPIGSFDPAELGIDEGAADYVPLGAYAPVGSTISDGDHEGVTMLPSLAGLGLVSPRTAAIASIGSAGLWGDDAPIDAIRVRVGGISGYTADATREVVTVAQAIEALGFSTSIVAGSSPADVDVTVGGYAFGVASPDTAQSVGTLGAVTQRWSELGAAARVELSVSASTLVVFGIALTAAASLLGAVQLAGISARREQSTVMREIGLTKPQIIGWLASEEVPGLAIVAAVAAASYLLSGGSSISAIAAVLMVAVVAILAVASVVAGSRRASRHGGSAPRRTLGARSVAGFGARQALVHPLTTLVHGLSIVIVGLSSTGLVAVVLSARADAGDSSLAALVSNSQLLPQVLLGGVGIAGGILLARLTRRLDLERRAAQWETLRAAGWSSGELARAQRAESLVIVVPSIVVLGVTAWFGATMLGLEPPPLFAVVAVVAGAVGALVALTTRRKGFA
ncbi:MAG TPA: hypothetical protein VNT50_04350 [Microbacterium sp.]|uniref:hypothetical protein n=1 Tax=Microbacterium sp. TaxID=51671 RepID=UPI002CA99A37|nr:hypothetical protein [Microbacterium sp.]HWI30697.1 hypothetical protein [Microbacterium sp.]